MQFSAIDSELRLIGMKTIGRAQREKRNGGQRCDAPLFSTLDLSSASQWHLAMHNTICRCRSSIVAVYLLARAIIIIIRLGRSTSIAIRQRDDGLKGYLSSVERMLPTIRGPSDIDLAQTHTHTCTPQPSNMSCLFAHYAANKTILHWYSEIFCALE